ncbi:hypothetical protein VNO77_24957 [Canavalia gladiata]|uniref:Uncharacterized protein n=1 Tax=Canavalia gladiata TaxID=3824 RepID=A0AAN9LCG5_CANGL
MGLHMVALAKLHLQLTSHGLKPALFGVACPLVLKVLLGFRLFRNDALYKSRLFLFQLGHIAFNREAQISYLQRMERALRLIWRTLIPATASSSMDSQIGERTLHDLSMLAL